MAVLISVITWFAIIEGLSFCSYALLSGYFSQRTVCYALSKTLGLFTFGYVVWVLGLLQIIEITTPSLVAVAATLLLGTHLFIKQKFNDWDRVPYPEASAVRTVESVFFGAFLVFYIIQCFHPEIYWGEKPMDFTFLNFFTRQTHLPPQDPWAAGNTMSYYYFGSFLFGSLHKLSGLPTQYGFGISIATVASLFVTSLFGALFALVRSARASIVGAICVAGFGTYDAIYLKLFSVRSFQSFDYYWATSRTFHEPGINEYALWTTLFADLHAHYIAFPMTAAFVAASVLLVNNCRAGLSFRQTLPSILLAGFIWGFLAAINTWDFITFGGFIGLLFGLLVLNPDRDVTLNDRGRIACIGIATGIVSILISLPFHLSVTSGAKVQWGYVYPEEYNSYLHILRIHGHWILLLLISALGILHPRRERYSIASYLFVLVAGLFPVWMGLVHIYIHTIPSAPWDVLLMATFVCLGGAILFVTSRDNRVLSAAIIMYCAGFLLTMMELHFLMDRMNTTFKINNAIWMLFGLSACSLVTLAYEALALHRTAKKVFVTLASVFAIPAFAAGLTMVYIMCTFVRIPGPRPTVDGMAYLEQFNPVEKQAIDWLRTHVQGTPVMVEAVGPSYQEFTRFAMHTGIPVVLGWEYHVSQRGTRDGYVRKNDVDEIYNSADYRDALKLLNKYGADIIIVGKQERTKYSATGLAKFDAHPEMFPLLFQADTAGFSVKIYSTTYSQLAQ